MPPIPFANLTLQQAVGKLPKRGLYAEEIRDFVRGEHWRHGDAWIGEKPADPAQLAKIAAGLVSENITLEILTRHVGGVLGREPRWGLVQRAQRRIIQPRLGRRRPDAAQPLPATPGEQAVDDASRQELDQRISDIEDALTGWWDERNIMQLLQQAMAVAASEGRAPLRVFIPPGLRDDGRLPDGTIDEGRRGTIPPPATLADALEYIFVDQPDTDSAGVYLDPATRLPLGVYRYADDQVTVAEVTYAGDDRRTVLRVLRGDDQEAQGATFDLGRRLFLYDLTREPLITPQILQNQKALNLTLTQMMRNVNLAGSRERYFLGARPPGEWVAATEGEPGAERFPDGAYRRFVAGKMPTGAGVSNWLVGEDIRDDDGKVVGVSNPNVSITDPVDVTNFEKTRLMFRAAALNQAQQAHALIAGDATASGKSREQARAEYKVSLEMSKTAMDDAGRWLLETVLYLAAELMRRPGAFADLRAEMGCIVDTGPLSPEEQMQIRDNVREGILSRETAMSQIGIDDVDAEQERIERERTTTATTVGAQLGAFFDQG